MSDPSLETMRAQLLSAAKLLPEETELTFRPMFGGVSGYVEGRVFASLSNIGLALKLAPVAQEQLLNIEDAERLRYEPYAPESKQYIVVPPRLCADERELAVWVRHSVEFVRTLPAPKPKLARTTGAGR